MKRIVLLICFVVVMLSCQGCNSTASKTTRLEDYKDWDGDVNKMLQENFHVPLPERELIDEYGISYYCNTYQAVLGDQNVVICLEVQLPSVESNLTELEEYITQLKNPIVVNESSYYLIQYSYDNAISYMDNNVYDGMFYNFEIVAVSPEGKCLILIAHVWDYYQDQILVDYLKNITEMIRPQDDE